MKDTKDETILLILSIFKACNIWRNLHGQKFSAGQFSEGNILAFKINIKK